MAYPATTDHSNPQEQNRTHAKEQGTAETAAITEYTPSEYARSEYPLYTPEKQLRNGASRDPFASRSPKPAVAAEETVWSELSAQPLARLPKQPEAPKPGAPAPDADLPWWLSEAPLATSEFSAAQSGPAAPRDPAARPASDEPVRLPVSRLSGLRSVIFGTGSRSLRKREAQEPESTRNPEAERVFDQHAESPVSPAFEEIHPPTMLRTVSNLEPLYETPMPEPPAPRFAALEADPVEPVVFAPRFASEPVLAPAIAPPLFEADPEQTVLAQEAHIADAPEVLPLQPIAPPRHRPDTWNSEPKQLDRGDTMDDIPLLPSRRGQYRRKG